jgi:hypothetical protein
VEFRDNQAHIQWVLSYMKFRQAATFASKVLCLETQNQRLQYHS